MQCNTGGPHSSLALHRSGGGCPLAIVRVASAADVGSKQIVTQQSAHGKLRTAISDRWLRTKASLNIAITHFDHMFPADS